MKIFYNGREIPEVYAKMLEANGQAHFGNFVSKIDDTDGPMIIMDSGPGNNWLETQPPERFLMHVFGHTCTWKEMAEVWERNGEYGMGAVASALRSLNHWLLQVAKERAEEKENASV